MVKVAATMHIPSQISRKTTSSMEFQIQSPLLVFALFLLVNSHVAHGRPIPSAPHQKDDHHLINMIFFHQKDLKLGNSIPLFFPIRNPNKTPKFLPKSVSDSLPFSLPLLPSLLQTLRVDPTSPQADSMAETLTHCGKPPVKGESKFCATSLESLLDSLRDEFGSKSRLELLTTSSRVMHPRIQSFKVVEDPKEIGAPNSMACHLMPYPYAVFYCHGQRGSNRLYELEMETERDGERIRVRVMAICHTDTSDWDPNHMSFRMMGIRPGQEPVCHAFPPDNLVWVPKRNSTTTPPIKTMV